MDDLMNSKEFCTGVSVGISLYQNMVIRANEQKEPLMIGDSLYYIQSGRERLQEFLEKICK